MPAPFGAITLDMLRPSDVEALILAMRAKTKPGKRRDDDTEPEPVRALSDSTIRQTYTILRGALDGAVRDGLLARNPAAVVKRPPVEHREAHHLPAPVVTAVLQAAEHSRYYPALMLIGQHRTVQRRSARAALGPGGPRRRNVEGGGDAESDQRPSRYRSAEDGTTSPRGTAAPGHRHHAP